MWNEAREVDRSFRASYGHSEDLDFSLRAITIIEINVLNKEAMWLDWVFQKNTGNSVEVDWKNHLEKQRAIRKPVQSSRGLSRIRCPRYIHTFTKYWYTLGFPWGRETPTSNIYFTLVVKILKTLSNNIFWKLKIRFCQYRWSDLWCLWDSVRSSV